MRPGGEKGRPLFLGAVDAATLALAIGVAVGALALGPGCAPRAGSGGGTRAAVAYEAPPPLRSGPIPPRPSPSAVWIDGHWDWTGRRYAWVPGRWETDPPGREWLPGHWRKTARGWKWVSGRWTW